MDDLLPGEEGGRIYGKKPFLLFLRKYDIIKTL